MGKTVHLQPEEPTNEYIQGVRNRMINGVLIAFACVAPLMLGISLPRALQHGWQPIYIVHCILALATLGGALFRNRLSYQFRAVLFLGIAFILGALGLPAFGLTGGGHIILVMFSILAAIGFGTKAGLLATLVNVILMIIVAFMVCTGRLTFSFDITEYATSPSAWGSVIIDFILIVPMVVLAIGSVYSQLQTTLKSVKESHASHQRLADNLTNSFLYRYSEGGTIKYVSAIEEVLGYQQEEFTNLTKHLTPHPGNRNAFQLPPTMESDEIKRSLFEIQIYHKNGSKRWLQISETIVNTPTGIKAEGLAHDITRRKIRETAITNILATFSTDRSTNFYEEMMERLAETLQCDIAFFGHIDEEKPESITTEAFYLNGKIIDNVEYDLIDSPCERIQAGGVCICPSGIQGIFPKATMLKKHEIEGYAGIAVNDRSGRQIGFMVTLWKEPAFDHDLIEPVLKMFTEHLVIEYERRKDEKKRAMLEEQLRQSQKMDAVGQLAGGIAHDFNNMLMGIMGASDLLKLRLNNDHEAHEYHDMIVSSSRRAADLTRQLLTFARKRSIGTTRADVHEAISNAVSLLSSTLDRRIEIAMDLKAKQSTITGDSTQIQNAIMNLGINAAHSMPDGGLIQIRTEIRELDKTYCNHSSFSLKTGNYISISVKDEGCGIQKNHLSKIFEPFFTTKTLGQGTGLGLSTVLGTVQQHQGEIRVISEPDSGSSFTINLPLCEAAEEDEPPEDAPIDGSGRILLVEDEPTIQKTVSGTLRQLGYEVCIANNGREGLECFNHESGNFDLVILDMVMPEMNGRECFFKMKQIDEQVRVILSSGFADKDDIRDMTEAGLCGSITKPYSCTELSRMAMNIINKHEKA